jgi:hypothetical protein
MKKTKKYLISLLNTLKAVGIDLRVMLSYKNIFWYLKTYNEFQRLGGKITAINMQLTDINSKSGTARGHYFHQDLLVANYIFQNKPIRHIDIGSRVDGFVAHVASFREIEVLDIRDLEDSGHPNIKFLKKDLMSVLGDDSEVADSISCLHAIEHFGLGRYGDKVSPKGHVQGLKNIVTMLKKNGTLYISFPIGVRSEVHFNAHRIFEPTEILSWAKELGLTLINFDFVDLNGNLQRKRDLDKLIIKDNLSCGIYTFLKNA